MIVDYERIRLSDGGGTLFESAERSADYQWLRPGLTEVHLEGHGLKLTGWMMQGEKADGVCLQWIEDAEISVNLHMVNRPPREWLERRSMEAS